LSNPLESFGAFGIVASGSCFGDASFDVGDLVERSLCTAERVEAIRSTGSELFFRSNSLSVEDLAIRAIKDALRHVELPLDAVDFVIFCSTVFESTALFPDLIACRIADAVGCFPAKTFAVQHAYCVSPFVALKLLKAYFSRFDRPAWGIIVCSDVIVQTAEFLRPIGTLGVHSDGAAAIVVTNNCPPLEILDSEIYIDPVRFRGRNDDGTIQHDVRYFMLLAKVLKTLLKRCRIESLDELGLYPNNLSAPSWHKIANLLSIKRENVHLSTMRETGHVFGADPFLNLMSSPLEDDRRFALLAATGIAGAFGASLLRRRV
jgi:3-oxoacyl-[acyl-carrier-protein] synthase III